MILAGTGHRPQRLGLGYAVKDSMALTRFVKPWLEKLGPTKVISGGAQGFDQALARAACMLGIPYVVAVPFEGQESKWPEEAQASYRKMLSLACEVKIVCEGSYAGFKFIQRDHWMVDNADQVIALWDGTKKGGTAATVKYAEDKGKPISNLWKDWNERTRSS